MKNNQATTLRQPSGVSELLQRLVENASTFENYRSTAKAYSEKEDFKTALAVYQESVIRFPDSAEGYCELGAIQERLNDFEGEMASYKKALELDANQPFWLYMTLARLLAERSRAESAIDLYQKGFELYPQEIDGLSIARLAHLLSLEGDTHTALSNYKLALERQPELDWVEFCIETLHYNQGVKFLLNGELRLAENHFQKVNQIKPSWEAPVWFSRDAMAWPKHHLSCKDDFNALKPQDVAWPKITIVTPSLNQGEFIEDTILSILNQEYENLEYIVIDGASTDTTLSILKQYQNKISVLLIEPDTGQSSAINKGFQIATGELFGWLNSDDMLAPCALYQIALAYLKTHCDVIAGMCVAHRSFDVEMVRKPSVQQAHLTTKIFVDYERWQAGDLFFQPEVFFSRQLWEESGGKLDETLHYAMDHELWARFAKVGTSIQVIDWPVGIFRKHNQQKTARENASIKELSGIMEQYKIEERIAQNQSSSEPFTDPPHFAIDSKKIEKWLSPDEYINIIQSLFDNGNWNEMLEVSQKMTLAYPENSLGYSWSGVAQEKMEDFEGQLISYENALRLDRNQPEWLYLVMGNLLYEKERWDEAIEVLKTSIELYPNSADAHRELGMCQEKVGDVEGQLRSYQRSLSLDEQQPVWVYAVLIRLLRLSQRLEESIEVGALAQGYFSEPDTEQAGIYFELAQTYADSGFLQKAIENYRLTLELDENLSEAKVALSHALEAYSLEVDNAAISQSGFERQVQKSDVVTSEHDYLLLRLQQIQEELESYKQKDKEKTKLLFEQKALLEKHHINDKLCESARNNPATELDKDTSYRNHGEEFVHKLSRTDVKKYDSRTNAARLVGFPPDLILPPIRGENNDYSFIEEDVKEFIESGREYELSVSVIVPVYNEVVFTGKILAGLSVQTYPKHLFEVVLVCNPNVTLEELNLEGYRESLNLVIREDLDSSCIGQSLNLGIKAASYDYIITLDPDILPTPGLVQRYMNYFHVYNNCLLLGERKFLSVEDITEQEILDSNGKGIAERTETNFDSESWNRDKDKKMVDASSKINSSLKKDRYPFRAFSSANAAYSVEILEKVGLFDEDLRHAGYQDKELGYRIYNSGGYFISVEGSLGVHQCTSINRTEYSTTLADAKSAKKLFEEKCPTSWDRKYEANRLYEVPKVSIYIPSYNNGAYIKEAIDSALNQTYTDLEICICDDGSTDNTLEVLSTYFGHNPRVRWMTQENGGIGKSSNSALKMCRGMYIGQLDSDDTLKSNAVETLVNYLDANNIGCVYSSCERVDADGNYLMDEYSYPRFSREKMLMTSIAHHFRMFRRKDWLRTEGFDEELVNAVDYDMFLKLSEVCSFYHIEEILYSRRWHGKNTSFVNENKQSSNTPRVITYSLERMNLADVWEVYAPDSAQPRKLSFRKKRKTTSLFFFPDYRKSNTYQQLLYSCLSDGYSLYSGDITDALQALEDGLENVIFHLHWTNYILRGAKDEVDARERKNLFLQKLTTLLTLGGKLVWTIHNTMPHDSEHVEQETELRTILSSLASVVHVHSESALGEIRKHFPLASNKVKIAQHGHYIGVDENIISRKLARKRFGFCASETVFLFVGQIRAYKGIEELVYAFSILSKQDESARLLIAGSCKDEIDIEMLCEGIDILDKVTYIPGYVESRELQYYYNAADAVVLPYRKILTSGSLIHAMSFGRPVIAPSLGMIEEIIVDEYNGFVYEPRNLSALVFAMEKICNLSRGENEKLGKNAFESIKVLGWDNTSVRVLKYV